MNYMLENAVAANKVNTPRASQKICPRKKNINPWLLSSSNCRQSSQLHPIVPGRPEPQAVPFYLLIMMTLICTLLCGILMVTRPPEVPSNSTLLFPSANQPPAPPPCDHPTSHCNSRAASTTPSPPF